MKDYPIEVIHNGIDLNVFKPTNSSLKKLYGLENKKIILGVSSVWNKSKGFECFLELSKLLNDSYKIILIGVDKKQIDVLPSNILGIEKTFNTIELAKWYSAADVFVNASQEETMGMTTIEAMACNTPVVTSNLTAVPEIVTSGDGLIVESYDAKCFKNCIEDIFSKSWTPANTAKLYEKSLKARLYTELYKN